VATGDLEGFRDAGRALFSLGLVRESEGNLSTFDGERLLITRTGCRLAELGEEDLLDGTLDAPPEGASSDVALHVDRYLRQGSGAVAHAHPPGSIPQGWVEGEAHGDYAFAPTLEDAVRRIVSRARESR
jgi:ribulose-5-phosphate 4-epimerase/fuculose-1-phosphate aldolase